MKTLLLLLLLAFSGAHVHARDRLVMVAPFDNFSGRHAYINYEVDTGAAIGNPRKQYRVDKYSHSPRELLEQIIVETPGLRPVERAQVDRVMIEVSGVIRDGIVDPEKAEGVRSALMNRSAFSGWGVRTIAAGEARYNPMSYHNGSIWPHDNAIIALGLTRYGFRAERVSSHPPSPQRRPRFLLPAPRRAASRTA